MAKYDIVNLCCGFVIMDMGNDEYICVDRYSFELYKKGSYDDCKATFDKLVNDVIERS